MTEGQQDALPVVEQEPKGTPIPEVSGGSPEAGSAQAGPDVSALAKELAEVKARLDKLPDDIDARFKSSKDKRFAKVDEIYEWAKRAGGDPKRIEDAVERQVLLERLEALEKPGSVSAPGRATDEDIESATAKFLNDLKDKSGIELSDDELKTVWSGKRYTSKEQAFGEVERYAWKKARQANVSPASVAAEGTATGPIVGNVDQLTRQLKKLMADTKTRPEAIKKAKDELEEALKQG